MDRDALESPRAHCRRPADRRCRRAGVAASGILVERTATPILRLLEGYWPSWASPLRRRLSDRLDTRVKVALGRNRGRLTVEFATVEDLDRILSVLDPGGPGLQPRRSEDDLAGAGGPSQSGPADPVD